MMLIKLAVVMFFVAVAVFAAGCAAKGQEKASGVAGTESFEEKTSEGAVTVSLTPEYSESGVLTVNYAFDTHSGSLAAINLREQVVLQVGGKEILPLNSPQLQGHHSSGVLEFKVDTLKKPFEIIVKGVPDVELRKFRWE